MIRFMLLAGVLAGVLVACGGDDGGDNERVLHLRTGDYTEAELLARFRTSGGLTETNCRLIDGLSREEVVDIIDANAAESTEVVQQPDPDDDLRQAELLLDECDRLFD